VANAARDTLLTTLTRAAPVALGDAREADRERLLDFLHRGASVWLVEISAYREDLDPSALLDRVTFEIARYGDGRLAIVRWAVVGLTDAQLVKRSRFPLRTYARAALVAVADALDAYGEEGLDYAGAVETRHAVVNYLLLEGGRLVDQDTRAVRTPPPRVRVRSGGGSLRSKLARVAELYREAVADGSHRATADVAETFGVSRATAARAVSAARRQGLLGPALRTRAGEQRDPTAQSPADQPSDGAGTN
jgi:hypothetical protein